MSNPKYDDRMVEAMKLVKQILALEETNATLAQRIAPVQAQIETNTSQILDLRKQFTALVRPLLTS